ncbi:MAG: FAD binding domain-containing protein [Spirochaetota bacterium]
MLHEFAYFAPESLDELLSFLAEHGEESKVFSGGTDLFVAIRAGLLKPARVVDLKKVHELHELSFDEGEGLSIGACVTVNELVDHPTVQARFPILQIAGDELATYQLRNRATVVGNIVTASPCGDMGSPMLCLNARVELRSSRGTRSMPLQEFITGVKKTQIAADEIVARILVPTDQIDARGGYKKLKRIKGHDLGVVSVALVKANGVARVAISSAAPTPVLLPDFPLETPVAEIQAKAQESISPIDDVRCTKEYRAFMVDVYIRRLMEEVARPEGRAEGRTA